MRQTLLLVFKRQLKLNLSTLFLLSLCCLVSQKKASAFDQNHSAWSKWLTTYTTATKGPATQVNYPALRKNPTTLDSYLQSLSSVQTNVYDLWTREQKMAFLINAYNAFTVKLIIDHPPTTSIRKIGSALSSPWKINFISLLGKNRSLDEIEHEMLRPVFKDPRIHFGVVCASIGCPRLQQEAFTAVNLNSLLDISTREFLSDTSRNQIYIENKILRVKLSKIFDWYANDFGGKKKLAEYVMPYSPLSDSDKKKASSLPSTISFLNYNWNLNGPHQ